MFVFEILKPGTWLNYEDRDWTWKIQIQLQSLESHFFEANGALNMFMQAQSNRPVLMNRDGRQRDLERRSEITNGLEKQYGGFELPDEWQAIRFESDVRFKREKWSEGRIPREFEHNLPFLYARAFLYALDAFDKFLGVLVRETNIPSQVAEYHAKLAEIFPDLRAVRNTTQHLEDRSRGLGAGRNPKPLEFKPINNGHIKASSGALVLNCLNGSKYGSTMADGHYGEIDVSPDSMQQLQQILQAVLNSFEWRGPKQHAPSA